MAARKKIVNINLVSQIENDQTTSSQIFSWAFTYGRYIIIITQIVVLSVFFLRFKLDRDHADLKESVEQKQAIVDSISDLENEIYRIQEKLASINKITTNQNIPLKVFQFLQENTPIDTTYTVIALNNNTISFNATAGSLRSFSFLLKRLQQNNKFSEVVLEDIKRRLNGRIEFKINANVNLKEFN